MTLKQLQYFIAVCNCNCNITKAAAMLYVSQSSISAAIQELETEFKVMLFFRNKKRLFLTENGKLFQHFAQKILDDVAELEHAFSQANRTATPLTIGFSALSQRILSDAFTAFCVKYPHLLQSTYTFETKDQLELLQRGVIQLMVVGTSIIDDYSAFDMQVLTTDVASLYTYPDNPLAQQPGVEISQLNTEPLLFFVEKAIDSAQLEDYSSRLSDLLPGFAPQNVLHFTSQIDEIQRFIYQKHVSAIFSSKAFAETEGIVRIPIIGAKSFQIAALWRKNILPDSGVQFIEFIKKYMARQTTPPSMESK